MRFTPKSMGSLAAPRRRARGVRAERLDQASATRVQATSSAAGSDDQAVADFYRRKTVRIVVGYAAGGAFDVHARTVARHLPRYVPGNPNVIVENRPGAGGILAANLVYSTEPKDGTVMTPIGAGLPLQQAIGVAGIQFDAARFNWLAAGGRSLTTCVARVDSGIGSIQDVIDGAELITGAIGPGTPNYDIPAVLNIAIGTRFKIVAGYEAGAKALAAAEAGEVNGACPGFDTMTARAYLFDEPNPLLKAILVMGGGATEHPWLRGVPSVESLARTEEAGQLIRAISSEVVPYYSYGMAPEVPADRVAALRKAMMDTFNDPQYVAEAERAAVIVSPTSGEEVARIYQGVLSTPPATLAKLKEALK